MTDDLNRWIKAGLPHSGGSIWLLVIVVFIHVGVHDDGSDEVGFKVREIAR